MSYYHSSQKNDHDDLVYESSACHIVCTTKYKIASTLKDRRTKVSVARNLYRFISKLLY